MEMNFDIIEQEIANLKRQNIEQRNQIEEVNKQHEKALDKLFYDILEVLDSFNKAEQIIKERALDNDENASKAIKRLLSPKKKVLNILNNYHVEEITFDDGMMRDAECRIYETEPDTSKPDGTIVSIEKPGYKRNGRLLRPAEVIIVRN